MASLTPASQDGMASVNLTSHAGVATVTLAEPNTRNAITLPMVEEIAAVFDALEADASVGAVVVTGQGGTFCAGADLSVLETGDSTSFTQMYSAFLRVRQPPPAQRPIR